MIPKGTILTLYSAPLKRQGPIGEFSVVEDITDLDALALSREGKRKFTKNRYRMVEDSEGLPRGSVRRLVVAPSSELAQFYMDRFAPRGAQTMIWSYVDLGNTEASAQE